MPILKFRRNRKTGAVYAFVPKTVREDEIREEEEKILAERGYRLPRRFTEAERKEADRMVGYAADWDLHSPLEIELELHEVHKEASRRVRERARRKTDGV